MNTEHRLIAACLLLAVGPAWSAAPPLLDSLPMGAIARLGHARMIAGSSDELTISHDGQYVSSEVWMTDVKSSFLVVRWFRLSDGKEAPPPLHCPKGYKLMRIYSGGRHLVGKRDRFLLLDSATGKPSSIIDQVGPVYFARSDRWCVKTEQGKLGDVLYAGALGQLGAVRWQRFASFSGTATDLHLSSKGGRAAWLQGGPGCIRVYDFDSRKLTTLKGQHWRRRSIAPRHRHQSGRQVGRLPLQHGPLPLRHRSTRIDPIRSSAEPLQARSPIHAGQQGGCRPHGAEPNCGARPHMSRHGKETVVPSFLDSDVAEFSFFPDGKRHAIQNREGVIRIHDLATGKQLDRHSRFPAFRVVRIVGKDTVACWGAGGLIVLWDIRTGRVLSESKVKATEGEKGLDFVEFGPGGASVLCWIGKDRCLLAESKSGKVIARLTANPGPGWEVWRFPLLGKSVASLDLLSRNQLRLSWHDPAGIRPIRRIPLPIEGIPRPQGDGEMTPQLSPDGRFLLLAGRGLGVLFELASGKVRWHRHLASGIEQHQRPAARILFDRRARRVVVVQGAEHHCDATLFDVLSGRKLAVITGCWLDSALSGSGRWLASNSARHEVSLWDLHSKYPADPVLTWTTPQKTTSIDLDEEGKRLVTAHADGTCFVWDMEALRAGAAKTWDATAWERLGAADPAKAVPVMAALVKEPARAVRMLAGKLARVPDVPRKRIADWIAQLDANTFKERAVAERRLAEYRAQAEEMMRESTRSAQLEVRLRLGRLLLHFPDCAASPKAFAWLRQVRAIEVLERIASLQALAILKKLAGGASGAALTRAARATLDRLPPSKKERALPLHSLLLQRCNGSMLRQRLLRLMPLDEPIIHTARTEQNRSEQDRGIALIPQRIIRLCAAKPCWR